MVIWGNSSNWLEKLFLKYAMMTIRGVLGIVLFIIGLYFSNTLFSQTINNNITITLEIHNVVINGGKIYVSIYSNQHSFLRREPNISLEFEANDAIIFHSLTIAPGEYAITLYQDENDNGRLDFGLFGIPRELFGMSNWTGRGFPSNNFDRLKILVNNTTRKIVVGLYRL